MHRPRRAVAVQHIQEVRHECQRTESPGIPGVEPHYRTAVPLPHVRLLLVRKVRACLLAAGADSPGWAVAAVNFSETPLPGVEDCRKLMASDSKPSLVREFLCSQLPDFMVTEMCDPDPETLAFVISTPSHSTLLKIRKRFIEHENSRKLLDMLNKMDIPHLLKQHPDIDAFVIS